MAGESHATTDHNEIQQWVEERQGKPATVNITTGKEDTGLLRIDFPGYRGAGSLEEISWDEFFKKFDEKNLAFLYQVKTSGGEVSRFCKFISRDSEEYTKHKSSSHSSEYSEHASHTSTHKTEDKAHMTEHKAEQKADSKAHSTHSTTRKSKDKAAPFSAEQAREIVEKLDAKADRAEQKAEHTEHTTSKADDKPHKAAHKTEHKAHK